MLCYENVRPSDESGSIALLLSIRLNIRLADSSYSFSSPLPAELSARPKRESFRQNIQIAKDVKSYLPGKLNINHPPHQIWAALDHWLIKRAPP
mmetsp:Transcript_4113/g.6224  ORF Transcript_4113/g.6224 Transcript_4113/m.6224 type:complete len:94 (-) Transcript_4113:2881-3162(-)